MDRLKSWLTEKLGTFSIMGISVVTIVFWVIIFFGAKLVIGFLPLKIQGMIRRIPILGKFLVKPRRRRRRRPRFTYRRARTAYVNYRTVRRAGHSRGDSFRYARRKYRSW